MKTNQYKENAKLKSYEASTKVEKLYYQNQQKKPS